MSAAGAALTGATRRLHDAGVPSPRVDAELLLAHVLGVARSRLALIDTLEAAQRHAYEAAVARRVTREPLQHIVGRAWFRNVEVGVGPGVFVPRPETELLVDAVLETLRAAQHPVAVDLCSGSGALALAIADEVPGAVVLAVERPGPAAQWLTRNVAGSGVAPVLADLADADLLLARRGAVHAVVCNPPYVALATVVADEVRHDPAEAVFAGADGLDVIPRAIGLAAELLRSGGVLALEHDDTQGAVVSSLLGADPRWTAISACRDLAGRPRYAVATRA